MPLPTLEAFRDHGIAVARLEDDLDDARAIPSRLAQLGIDLAAVAQQLEDEGVRKFIEPYDQLLATLQTRIRTHSRHMV